MRITIQKMVEMKGTNNPSKDSHKTVYSQPFFKITQIAIIET